MNPRQRRLRRQRRKDRNERHEYEVEHRHEDLRRHARLTDQALRKVAPAASSPQPPVAPLTGGALLSSVLSGLKT